MRPIILILLISSIASADQVKKAVKLVDRAGQAVKKANPSQPENCDLTSRGEKQLPLWQQCLSALCPGGFGRYDEDFKRAAALQVQGPVEQEVLDQVKKAFNAELEAKIQSYERLLALVKSGKPLNDPQALQLGQFLLARKRMSRLVYQADGSVDPIASRMNAADLSDEDFNLTVDVAGVITKTEDEAKEPYLREDYDFYSQRFPPELLPRIVAPGLSEFSSSATSLETLWGVPAKVTFRSSIFGTADRLKSGQLQRKDLDDFSADLKSARVLNAIGNDRRLVERLRARPLQPSTLLGTNAGNVLESRIEYMKAFLEKREPQGAIGMQDKLNEVIGTCARNLKVAKQFAPTSGERDTYKTKMDRYRQEFVEGLSPYLSAHSKGVLERTAATWKLALPPTYEEYRSSLLRHLQDHATKTTALKSEMTTLAKNKPQVAAVADLIDSSEFQTDPEYAKDLNDLCLEKFPNPLSDKASIGFDRHTVGAYGLKNETYGEGAAKHEFGHLLSGIFQSGIMSPQSKGWYDNTRACMLKAKGDQSFVEEEGADLGSALTGRGTEDCEVVQNLESEVTLRPSTTDTNPNRHSSTLYRMLHQAFVRNGRTPTSCDLALAAKGETFKPVNCSR